MKTLQEPQREFKNGDRVIAGYMKLDMIIIDAVLCVKGWRYQLGFPKKDGTLNKKMNHRFFNADNLKHKPK